MTRIIKKRFYDSTAATKETTILDLSAKQQEEEKPVTKEQGMEQVKTALSNERIPSTKKKA